MTHPKQLTLSCTLLMVISPGIQASQIAYSFTKIADTGTTIPGGSGTFTDFDGLSVGPALSAGIVAFTAAGTGGQHGVYRGNIGGPLVVVADTTMPIPGSAGNFTDFGGAANFSGGQAMRTFGSDGYQAVFKTISGPLSLVADTNTPVPSGVGNFKSLSLFYSFDGQNVAFCGTDALDRLGVYTDVGGQLTAVANSSTPIPGGTGTFTTFNQFDQISNGNTAFLGFGLSGQAGIYTDIGGHLNVVADTHTPIPGGVGTFTGFGSFSFEDGNIVFLGFGSSGQKGYYTNLGGALRVVVDTMTPIPDGIGNFTDFGLFIGPALNGSNIAISGLGSSGQAGLYIEQAGLLSRVIDNSELLDGKSFSNFAVYISPMALDGNQVALSIQFNDLSQGLFVATPVPERSTLFLAGIGTLIVLALLRKTAGESIGLVP